MESSFRPAVSWTMKQLRLRPGLSLFYVCLSLLFAVAEWLEPVMLERFVNSAVAGQRDDIAIIAYVSLLVLTSIPFLYYLKTVLKIKIRFDLNQQTNVHFLKLDAAYYGGQNTSQLVKHLTKAQNGTISLVQVFVNPTILVQIPLAIMASAYIAQESVPVVLCLLGFMVVYLAIGLSLGRRMAIKEKEENELDTTIATEREEMVAHVPFLQQQQVTDRFYQAMRALDKSSRNQNLTLTRLYAFYNWLAGNVGVLGGLLAVVYFLPRVIAGELSVGTFFALYLYVGMVVAPALHLGDLYAQFKSAWAEAEPLPKFFAEQPRVKDVDYPLVLEPLKHQISFDSVTFFYPQHPNKMVLRDASFLIL